MKQSAYREAAVGDITNPQRLQLII